MAPGGNPNVFIDPSKKMVMYAHVKSSDTVLQRYNIVGLPTVIYFPSLRGDRSKNYGTLILLPE